MAACIGTWVFSLEAVKLARSKLREGSTSLDAVEEAIAHVEDDPATGVYFVGRGGCPNAAGVLQCDAALMSGIDLNVGAVAGLEGYATPVRVARQVLEECPHFMLVGDGARDFAISHGMQPEANDSLVSEQGRQAFLDETARRREGQPQPGDATAGVQGGHDTLGLIARDTHGNITAGVSTSGMGLKLPGRVGDSPLPGGGLYADNNAGAACATGDGDLIVRHCAAYRVVQLMSNGYTPQRACESVVGQIAARVGGMDNMFSMGLIAMDTKGECGASGSVRTWCDNISGVTYPGFTYVSWCQGQNHSLDVAVAPYSPDIA